jgi:hypothetical protein
MNKISVKCNQPFDYITRTLTTKSPRGYIVYTSQLIFYKITNQIHFVNSPSNQENNFENEEE